MSLFLQGLYSGRVLLMDGAMGTELRRAGIREGECFELWNVTHPDRVRAIHQAYADAGAQCLLTNTFQANPFALAKHGLENQLERINQAAVEIARWVAGKACFVVADIGPFAAKDVEPGSKIYLAALSRVVQSLGAADAVLFETWSDPTILDHVGEIVDLCRLPLLISFAYRPGPLPGGFSLGGGVEPGSLHPASTKHVAALGVNCGRDIGMGEIIEIIRRYRQVRDLPLFARPNAGSPTRQDDRWVYPRTPEQMATRLPDLLEAGVSMVGGCCGTTPEHIAAFRPVIEDWNADR